MASLSDSPAIPPRNRSFDGLRGVAMIAVVAHHAGLVEGVVGVVVFFVLSGYLITRSLVKEKQREGTVNLLDFYRRRALRIYPAMLVLVAVYLAYSFGTQSPAQAKNNVWIAVAGLSNVANWVQVANGREVLGALNHLWTISVQEQFYILWPFALWLLLRKEFNPRLIAVIATVGVIGSGLLRWALWEGEQSVNRLYYGSDTRADALFIGALVALLTLKPVKIGPVSARILSVLSLSALLLLGILEIAVPKHSWSLYVAWFPIAVLCGGVVLTERLIVTSGSLTGFLKWGPLAWLGQIGYGIYLWHYPLHVAFERSGWPVVPRNIAWIGATLVLSAASWHLVERRFMATPSGRRSTFPSARPALATE